MINRWFFLIYTLLVFTSCGESNPHKKVDVQEETIPFVSERMDQDIFNTDFNQAGPARQKLYQKYGPLYCAYVEDILKIGPCQSDSSTAALKGFATYPDMLNLQKDIEQSFSQDILDQYNSQFEDALKRLHHFFPEQKIPAIVYMNSGFNCASFATDTQLAVGLDEFLGEKNQIVKQLPGEWFPTYTKKDMDPALLIPSSLKNLLYSRFAVDPTTTKNDLLNELVYHGKMMYVLDVLLPKMDDSLKMAWSASEVEWAEDNVWNVWKELARQEIMFGTSVPKNKKWFEFAPFTNAENIPQDSPPQLGIYMGWEIVKAYMSEHPELSPADLLAEKDAQKILKAYKPKR